MSTEQSLTKAAVEAMRNNAPSHELQAHYDAIEERTLDVDNLIQAAQIEADNAPATGDATVVKATRQRLEDLREENVLLCRIRTDVHQAIKSALGAESMAAEADHRRELAKALTKAEKAHQMLEEVRQTARELARARHQARDVGGDLAYDKATIRALAELVNPPGSNQSKQMMVDLGLGSRPRYLAA